MTERGISVPRLCAWLVWLRFATLLGALRSAPRVGARRVVFALALFASAAYAGLFLSALSAIGEEGGSEAEQMALGVVGTAIVLASVCARVAAGPAAAQSPEGELLRCAPVSLPVLVVARSLSSAATHVLDALFLVPVLGAAALSWDLGWMGLLAAVATSIVIQVGVAAAAELGQIACVRLFAPRARAALLTALALLSALSMATVWMAGSWVLRAPVSAAGALARWAESSHSWPLRLVVAPMIGVATGGPAAGVVAWVKLSCAVALVVVAAAAVAAWAAPRFEPAGVPWSASSRGPRPLRGGVSVFGKDLRLFGRDRARAVGLVALPVIFVGVQVFGSAGWDWSTHSPRRMAMLAYSLAAYAATLGPLRHMDAERRAFWILLAAPRSMASLFAGKAAFWSLALATLTASVYLVLAWSSGVGGLGGGGIVPSTRDLWGCGVLAVSGAALLGWLAVGVGGGAADLTDDSRGALGLGSAYLFLFVAGLFNLALGATPEVGARILALFALVTALCFGAGAAQARFAYELASAARARLTAGDGAITCVLLLGVGRGGRFVAEGLSPAAGALVMAVGHVLVALAAFAYLARRGLVRGGRPAFVVVVVVGMVAAAGLSWARVAAAAALPAAALAVLAQELVLRGMVQRGLWAEAGKPRSVRTHAVALGASAALGFLLLDAPVGQRGATALVPAAAYAATGSLAAALAARAAVALLVAIW